MNPLLPPPPAASAQRFEVLSKNQPQADERFNLLRRTGPLLYDSFINHNLYWGSLSVAWGELTGYNDEFETEQSIYFAGRSDGEFNPAKMHWRGSPGEFFAAKVLIPKPHTQSAQSLSFIKENRKTKKVTVYKRMIHPGEVNRIRSFPQAPHLIATLSDSPTTFVWDTKTQPNRLENQTDTSSTATAPPAPSSAQKKKPMPATREFTEPCLASVPDFSLEGHTSSADFALDTKGSRDVISAGADKLVMLWDLESAPVRDGVLAATCVFRGHAAPVEDCSFRPGSSGEGSQLCSVGQDRELLLWDSRQGGQKPTSRTLGIHTDDANCCAWNPFQDWILTGGSDGVVNVFDCRQLGKGAVNQVQHKGSVINVRWSPHDANVFASSDESQFVTLFRLHPQTGVEMLLQHGAHRSTVVDFQFNPINPWVVVSVSDDSSEDTKCGGGTMQTWRVSDLVHKDAGADLEWAGHMRKLLRQTASTASPDHPHPDDEQ